MKLDFNAWLRWVFEHEVVGREARPWHFTPNLEMWDCESDPQTTLAYIIRLFSQPEILIGPYSTEQIGQGLWFLVDPSCSSHLLAVLDARIEWAVRKQAIDSVVILYEHLFRQICGGHVSHLDQESSTPHLANRICYMFWEVCPFGPGDLPASEHDMACLDVMGQILAIDDPACQEGALHGLAHWSVNYPQHVGDMLDDYLGPDASIHPALYSYATRVRASLAR